MEYSLENRKSSKQLNPPMSSSVFPPKREVMQIVKLSASDVKKKIREREKWSIFRFQRLSTKYLHNDDQMLRFRGIYSDERTQSSE